MPFFRPTACRSERRRRASGGAAYRRSSLQEEQPTGGAAYKRSSLQEEEPTGGAAYKRSSLQEEQPTGGGAAYKTSNSPVVLNCSSIAVATESSLVAMGDETEIKIQEVLESKGAVAEGWCLLRKQSSGPKSSSSTDAPTSVPSSITSPGGSIVSPVELEPSQPDLTCDLP
ncbi:hypothetical protein EYF80_026071 [Liparis tanakae]|uniref:Uncharacterized protein n=1 Tax=Liparis tanakae TaxID=230148 RepID=A0A4Z2HFR1_9TELE|nr:hypothetical protein EYF80_026071 [Liparis tanakae]